MHVVLCSGSYVTCWRHCCELCYEVRECIVRKYRFLLLIFHDFTGGDGEEPRVLVFHFSPSLHFTSLHWSCCCRGLDGNCVGQQIEYIIIAQNTLLPAASGKYTFCYFNVYLLIYSTFLLLIYTSTSTDDVLFTLYLILFTSSSIRYLRLLTVAVAGSQNGGVLGL